VEKKEAERRRRGKLGEKERRKETKGKKDRIQE